MSPETAAQREARLDRAASGRGRDDAGLKPVRRASVTRTRPVRVTVDMPPPLHRRFKEWLGAAAEDLDVADVAGAEVVRILVARLTSATTEAGRDPGVQDLVEHVLDELRAGLH